MPELLLASFIALSERATGGRPLQPLGKVLELRLRAKLGDGGAYVTPVKRPSLGAGAPAHHTHTRAQQGQQGGWASPPAGVARTPGATIAAPGSAHPTDTVRWRDSEVFDNDVRYNDSPPSSPDERERGDPRFALLSPVTPGAGGGMPTPGGQVRWGDQQQRGRGTGTGTGAGTGAGAGQGDTRPVVPRLALPSPGPFHTLTRSTRRTVSQRTPSVGSAYRGGPPLGLLAGFPSAAGGGGNPREPAFSASSGPASDKLDALGREVGQALLLAELPGIIALKRRARMQVQGGTPPHPTKPQQQQQQAETQQGQAPARAGEGDVHGLAGARQPRGGAVLDFAASQEGEGTRNQSADPRHRRARALILRSLTALSAHEGSADTDTDEGAGLRARAASEGAASTSASTAAYTSRSTAAAVAVGRAGGFRDRLRSDPGGVQRVDVGRAHLYPDRKARTRCAPLPVNHQSTTLFPSQSSFHRSVSCVLFVQPTSDIDGCFDLCLSAQASAVKDISASEALVHLGSVLAVTAAVELRSGPAAAQHAQQARGASAAEAAGDAELRSAVFAAARAAGSHAARTGARDPFLEALAEGGQAVLHAAKSADDALDELTDPLRTVADYISSAPRGAITPLRPPCSLLHSPTYIEIADSPADSLRHELTLCDATPRRLQMASSPPPPSTPSASSSSPPAPLSPPPGTRGRPAQRGSISLRLSCAQRGPSREQSQRSTRPLVPFCWGSSWAAGRLCAGRRSSRGGCCAEEPSWGPRWGQTGSSASAPPQCATSQC